MKDIINNIHHTLAQDEKWKERIERECTRMVKDAFGELNEYVQQAKLAQDAFNNCPCITTGRKAQEALEELNRQSAIIQEFIYLKWKERYSGVVSEDSLKTLFVKLVEDIEV